MNTKEQVLQNCTIEGNIVKLPNVQLDRKLYLEVAKSLGLIGGKWKGGKISGFVFNTDPTNLLNQISNGEKRNLKKEFQFFGTPDLIANRIVNLANLKPRDTVLEPSAGQGALIKAINKIIPKNTVDCYELMDINISILTKTGFNFKLVGKDFLQHNEKLKYTKIIANPPFTKNQDIDHLYKMYNCLEKGGRVVCITSESWVNGTQKKQESFKKWLKEVKAEVFKIERGAFRESGTMVGGRIIVIDK